jgi:8-oxoguanine deaminase
LAGSHAARFWLRDPLAVFDPQPLSTSARGGLVVASGRIVERVAAGVTPPHDHSFDARGLVLLPGLVNTHHHFYQTLTRACAAALNKPLFPWLQSLYPLWARLTPPMVEVATELALAELLLSGCTTAVDHHYVFNAALGDAIDRQAAVARQLGMRVVLTRGSMSLGQSDGGLPPDAVVQDEDTILADSEGLLTRLHERADDAQVQVALAPCSPFSVTPQLLRETAALARTHDVLLHTHLAETEDENRFCEQHFGMRPLDLIEANGRLHARAWFAHGIHFDAGEVRRLGQAGAGVSHCPTSNMMLGSGTCRAAELEAAGVRVGLGVDGSASNDGSNLMQEVRQAFLLARLRAAAGAATVEPRAGDGALVSHTDALRWATLGSARVLHRSALGHLDVGAVADIACFALDELRFSGAGDPLAAVVLCGAHRARHVMVGGQWRVRDGEIPGLDLAALQARHRACAAELVAREGA